VKRDAIEKLAKWKDSKCRKPLILKGARQVGKTWLMKQFGESHYQKVAYINLEGNKVMYDLFDLDFNVKRIVDGIELYSGVKIEYENTLIILDEVQECPKALASLKYFYEDEPRYHVVVAGSLLGVALHAGTSFPVGKVDFMDIHPLSFAEFLAAIGEGRFLVPLRGWRQNADLVNSFHEKLLDMFKVYSLVGGMPEAVQNYIDEDNVLQIRAIQNSILQAYDNDFSKHAPVNTVPRIREIWNILPSQLVKENKKFLFSMIRSGARSKDYEMALLWLEDAGLVKRVTRVNSAKHPLKAYESSSIFKLFLLDTGLLLAKSEVYEQILLAKNALFTEYKGAITEQIIFQSLRTAGKAVYYYANDESRNEIDFMIDLEGEPIPVEVKSGNTLHSKSLNSFVSKHGVSRAIKFSTLPIKLNPTIWNLPIYLAEFL
jgi:predicted AAA+ superfamily ATPase